MQPDVLFPLQQAEIQNCPTRKASLCLVQSLLHDEIDSFCKQVSGLKLFVFFSGIKVFHRFEFLFPFINGMSLITCLT